MSLNDYILKAILSGDNSVEKKRKSHTLLGRVWNGTILLNCKNMSYKIKYSLTI